MDRRQKQKASVISTGMSKANGMEKSFSVIWEKISRLRLAPTLEMTNTLYLSSSA